MSEFSRIFSLEPRFSDYRLLREIVSFLQIQDREELFFSYGQSYFTRYSGVLQRVSLFEDAEDPAIRDLRGGQKEVIAELVAKFKEERPNFFPDVAESVVEFSFLLDEIRMRARIESFNNGAGIFVALKMFRSFPFALKGLGFPDTVVSKLVGMTKGLVLIAGPPASGKTTTALSLVQEITAYKRVIAVCYERPIEIPLSSSKSIIVQKNYGVDFSSWSELRYEKKSPISVIYISDIQSREAAEAALDLATAGKLVVATISGTSTVSALLNFDTLFLPEERQLRRSQLSFSFQAVIYQRLLQKRDVQNPFTLAFEALFASPKLKVLLAEGKYNQITTELQSKENIPYSTTLRQLFQKGRISEKTYKRELLRYSKGYVPTGKVEMGE